jgi:hypothetical protein
MSILSEVLKLIDVKRGEASFSEIKSFFLRKQKFSKHNLFIALKTSQIFKSKQIFYYAKKE